MKITNLLKSYTDYDADDVLLIIEDVLNIKSSRLFAMDDVDISPGNLERINTMVKRLADNEPVQYILGTWDFIDLTLKVDSRALIPRPETEHLAQLVDEYAKAFDNPKIIDLGCGTGCIGLYAKSKLKNAYVTLLDISDDAISLTSENATLLNLDVNIVHRDMASIDDKYDIIVSNPPYIRQDVIDTLDSSVKDFEPASALDGGYDGLDFYRLLAKMDNNLNDGGYLLMEIGYDQGDIVSSLLEDNFEDIKLIKDFEQNDRIITARKK